MIGVAMDITIQANFLQAVGPDSKPVRDAKFRNFGHAGASIRKDAINSIKIVREGRRVSMRPNAKGKVRRQVRYRASPPGTPIYGHRGKHYFRLGLLFDATQEAVIVGPTKTRFGDTMRVHEFGGEYKGANYPPRPTMGPALERALPRFQDSWRGAIEDT